MSAGNPLTNFDPYGLAGVKIGWGGGAALGIGGSANTGLYFSPDAANPTGAYMNLQQEYGFGASLTLFQIGFFAGRGLAFWKAVGQVTRSICLVLDLP